MRYLGTITRTGTLSPNGEVSAPATLEIECYENKGGMMLASGEVESRVSVIGLIKGQPDVRFVTDDGHTMTLSVCDSRKAPEGAFAQVVATGDLPTAIDGALGWPEAPKTERARRTKESA